MLLEITFKGGLKLVRSAVHEMLAASKTAVLLAAGQPLALYAAPSSNLFMAGCLVTGPCSLVKAVSGARRNIKEIQEYFAKILTKQAS